MNENKVTEAPLAQTPIPPFEYPEISIEYPKRHDPSKITNEDEFQPFKPEEVKLRANCTYGGTLECCNNVCCDAVGTDVSREFCNYCRHFSRETGIKPWKFAEKFARAIGCIEDELKKKPKENMIK